MLNISHIKIDSINAINHWSISDFISIYNTISQQNLKAYLFPVHVTKWLRKSIIHYNISLLKVENQKFYQDNSI
jgi:hypothetical protein